jgi:hypothetical protein
MQAVQMGLVVVVVASVRGAMTVCTAMCMVMRIAVCVAVQRVRLLLRIRVLRVRLYVCIGPCMPLCLLLLLLLCVPHKMLEILFCHLLPPEHTALHAAPPLRLQAYVSPLLPPEELVELVGHHHSHASAGDPGRSLLLVLLLPPFPLMLLLC